MWSVIFKKRTKLTGNQRSESSRRHQNACCIFIYLFIYFDLASCVMTNHSHSNCLFVDSFVYDLLTSQHMLSGKIQMLVACNKQDSQSPLGVSYIKKLLERELSVLSIFFGLLAPITLPSSFPPLSRFLHISPASWFF